MMNKDVLFTIYEILHRDLTKQLNAEYLEKLRFSGTKANICTCKHTCDCYIIIKFGTDWNGAYNYRLYIRKWMPIYTKYSKVIGTVPKNY